MIKQLALSYSQEFLHLEQVVFKDAGEKRPVVVQFTAAHREEGVTSITLAVAAFMAQKHGRRYTVAVDANFRNTAFRRVLSLESSGSLLGVVQRKQTLEEALQKVEHLGFYALPFDGIDGDQDQLFMDSAYKGLERTIIALKKGFRYILVDTSAVIPFGDSAFLSKLVDHVVLVVESGKTNSEVVTRAIEKVKAAGSDISGIVLNKREYHIPQWLYNRI
jgi:Mrp family chromosome partitioning ATPase